MTNKKDDDKSGGSHESNEPDKDTAPPEIVLVLDHATLDSNKSQPNDNDSDSDK